AAAGEALTKLGFTNFTIRLNHRRVLAGVLDAAGIAAEQQGAALVSIDKLDKIGRAGVTKEFAERDIAAESGARLLTFFEDLAALERAAQLIEVEEGNRTPADALNAAVIGRLVEFIGDHESGALGIDELRSIVRLSAAYGADAKIKIDPSLARGLSYYTGAIMEISVPDLAGSLGGGGRYDNLVGMFSGRDVPACGFSLGLERIIVVMTEREMFPPTVSGAPAEVLVTIWNEESFEDSLALAGELRRQGLRVDLYPEADKLGKQFKYASSRGIEFVAVVGEDERGSGQVALKNMSEGTQVTVLRDGVVEVVRGKAKVKR
ncbi:MAG: ATP phosphoribosyltransferase regulatory subunit, partial [Acidobacteriota bacterium]|nr:ATP phosphoribosyltransferase regulatory subunit [Acidobacteriota bacterium]